MATRMCAETLWMAPADLEGRLAVGERRRFRLHLVTCRRCRAFVRALRSALVTEPEPEVRLEPVSAETHDRLLSIFRAWHRRRAGSHGEDGM